MKKIYLASPFFNNQEIEKYDNVIDSLREQGFDVFVPREHTVPNGWDMPNHIWAENVFAVDYLAITKCEVVVVLNFGMYSDSGTAWECGCAYALGKKVLNVLCGEEDEEYSLMMLNGTNSVCYYTEIIEKSFEYVLNCDKQLNPIIDQK